MAKIDRLLCHPYRVFVKEFCTVLVKGKSGWSYRENESIVIPVDSIVGNPDPYVFFHPWLYGYCRNANLPDLTSPQSIILFGTYLKEGLCQESLLIDTVFAIGARYPWLGKEGGYFPSKAFMEKYPFKKDSKLYRDFIAPRVEDGQHPKAKAIFEALNADKETYHEILNTPHKRSDRFYSFIPLLYEDGIYYPIDVLPIIKRDYPKLFCDYKERRNRLYEIDLAVVKVIDYLIEKADVLVLKTQGQGMPEKLDQNLQRLYFNRVYNIFGDKKVEQLCKEICYSFRNEDD